MSRWLSKQTSFESPGAGHSGGQERRFSEDAGKGQRAKLNRSLTISSQPASGHSSTPSREPSSPLKRFAQAKNAIRRAFQHVGERLEESQAFMRAVRPGSESEGVASLAQRTQKIQRVLSRDRMKVAFFGRTSNGKSSVINALLHGRVLPVGIGHTTNCFCSVVGAEGKEAYLLTNGSEERRSIKSLQQLAHSLSSRHLDPNSLLRIFWPTSKCPLLAEDVEFVDSPGVDMNPNIDEWITKHCLDADVFVLVSNAESTLMTAEKNFFHRVSERISKPNVFILNNRWDASDAADIPEESDEGEGEGEGEGVDGGPQLMEQVMQQHLERDIKFLARELCVTDEQTARHRVFFVSAKEVLHYRVKQLQGSPDPGQGLAGGHRARLQNFEQFERRFKECLSSSAIRTKFEQHYKQGLSVVSDLGQLLEQEEAHLQQERERVWLELATNQKRAHQLKQQGPVLVANSNQLISEAVGEVTNSSSMATRDLLSQLPSLVDNYQLPFDLNDLSQYKAGLYSHFDEKLSAELDRVSATALTGMHEATQSKLIDAYKEVLQLSSSELRQSAPAMRVSYVLSCADLCQDFKEDLQFHFSLGLNTLSAVASTGSWLSGLKSRLSLISSVVSLEYAAPAVLLVTALLLPRLLHWRYLVPMVCVCGGLYSYEWLAWTTRSKEAALKKQFVQHMREKVQLQVKAINSSSIFQMQSSLGALRDSIHQRLQSCQVEAEENTVQLGQQEDCLATLNSRLKALRNAVQLSSTDLETFREDFLT